MRCAVRAGWSRAPELWTLGITVVAMKTKAFITVVVLSALTLALGGCATSKPSVPQVTIPNGRSPATDNPPPGHWNDTEATRKGWNHGNGVLWVSLNRPGPWVADEVERDGSLRVKFGWWKGYPGKFQVEGRRLDAPAPPLRCSINDEALDERIGPIPAVFLFPTEGYWEITGHLNGKSLAFVIHVVKKIQ